MKQLNVVSLADAPPAPDALAELIGEKNRIGREIERFAAVSARRTAAEAALAEVDAAIRGLDASEGAAWAEWAGKVDAPAPAPRREERRTLSARRAEAADDLDATRTAEAGVLPHYKARLVELQAVEAKMRAIRLAGVRQTAFDLHAEGLRLAAASGEPLESIAGLRETLIQQASAAAGRHDEAAQKDFLAEVTALDALKSPIVNADVERVRNHATAWRRRILQ